MSEETQTNQEHSQDTSQEPSQTTGETGETGETTGETPAAPTVDTQTEPSAGAQTEQTGQAEHSASPPPLHVPTVQDATPQNPQDLAPSTQVIIKTVRHLMSQTLDNFLSLKDFLNMIATSQGASLAQVATWLMFEMHNAHKQHRATPVPCFLDKNDIGLSIAQPQDLKLFLVSVRETGDFSKVEKLFKNEGARFGFMKTDFLEFLQRENLDGVELVKNYKFNPLEHDKPKEDGGAFDFPLLFPDSPSQNANLQKANLKGDFFMRILSARDLLKEQFAGFKNLKSPAEIHRFRLQHVQPWLVEFHDFTNRESSIISRLLVEDFLS